MGHYAPDCYLIAWVIGVLLTGMLGNELLLSWAVVIVVAKLDLQSTPLALRTQEIA